MPRRLLVALISKPNKNAKQIGAPRFSLRPSANVETQRCLSSSASGECEHAHHLQLVVFRASCSRSNSIFSTRTFSYERLLASASNRIRNCFLFRLFNSFRFHLTAFEVSARMTRCIVTDTLHLTATQRSEAVQTIDGQKSGCLFACCSPCSVDRR